MPHSILFYCDTYPAAGRWGGIGTYTFYVAQQLARMGKNIGVLTVAANCNSSTTVEEGVTIHREICDCGGLSARRTQIASICARLVRDYKYQLVEFPENLAFGLTYQQQSLRVPVVIRLHGAAFIGRLHNCTGIRYYLRKLRFWANMDALAHQEIAGIRLAESITTPTKWYADWLRTRFGIRMKRPYVLFNPLPARSLPDYHNRFPSRHILLFGRLDALKGADIYADVIATVCKQYPDAVFDIVGQDVANPGCKEHHANIIKRAKELCGTANVRYLGGVAAESVSSVLRRYRTAAFMSRIETWSYTMHEAMAEGVACVNGSVGGSAELGVDRRDYIGSARSKNAVANAILGLISSPGECERIGRNAWAKTLEYTPERYCERYLHEVVRPRLEGNARRAFIQVTE